MSESLKYFLLFLFASILLVACTATSNQDGRQILEIMKSHEIKKISEVEILNKAMEIGNAIADSSQKVLSGNLIGSMKNNGLAGSIQFRNTAAIELTDSLSKVYIAYIKRTSGKLRNKQNAPTPDEAQILEAYQYAADNELAMTPSVQIMKKNEQVLYTKPILIGNPVCLNCHGEIGKELTEENNKLIKSLYPSDKATGYRLKEFRGMWRIVLDKRAIVNAL
mgnify:FL=1